MYYSARRYFILSVFILVGLPVGLICLHRASSKVLYAGDRSENRLCRECRGSGKWAEAAGAEPPAEGRCPACGGDGLVEVILPGPLRPTRIRGMVAAREDLTEDSTYRLVRPPLLPGKDSGSGVPGIPGAKIRFEGPGEPVVAESNPLGLFNVKLAPGRYRVRVEFPARSPVESELEVPVLREEIWLEETNILREPASTGEAQARFGFEILVGLAAQDEGRGLFISCYGGP